MNKFRALRSSKENNDTNGVHDKFKLCLILNGNLLGPTLQTTNARLFGIIQC